MKTPNAAWASLLDRIKDFSSKAQPMFEANNWTWGTLDEGMRVPSQQNLEATLYSLAWEALREAEKDGKQCSCVSTGRLQCRFVNYPHRGWIGVFELVPISCENFNV